jgi:predicted nucleotidyltransferase
MKNQETLMNYLINKCKSQEGVKALYLKGSLARDKGDAYSDVDFYCLVEEKAYESFLEIRMDIIGGYKKVLYLEHVNFGLAQVIAIYEDNIHLDFYLTHEIPEFGIDPIKVLYDPDDILSTYKVQIRDVEMISLLSYLKGIIYTSQEVYASYMRGDDLWTSRLLSHMVTDLGLVYCGIYKPRKGYLHLKGQWHDLPESIKKDLEIILKTNVPGQYLTCVLQLLNHTHKLIEDSFNVYKDQLFIGYLDYMIKKFQTLSKRTSLE